MDKDKIIDTVVERNYELVASTLERLLDIQNQRLTPEAKTESIKSNSKVLLAEIVGSSLSALAEIYKQS